MCGMPSLEEEDTSVFLSPANGLDLKIRCSILLLVGRNVEMRDIFRCTENLADMSVASDGIGQSY